MQRLAAIMMCIAALCNSEALGQIPAPWSLHMIREPDIAQSLVHPWPTDVHFADDATCVMTPLYGYSGPEGIGRSELFVHVPEAEGRSVVVQVPDDADLVSGQPFLLVRTVARTPCEQYVRINHGVDDYGRDANYVEAYGALNNRIGDDAGSIRWMAIEIDGDQCTTLYSRNGSEWEVLSSGTIACDAPRVIGFGVRAGFALRAVTFQGITIGAQLVAEESSSWGSVKAQYR